MNKSMSGMLRPAALLYRAVVQVRNLWFEKKILRSRHTPVPVVSVGNITAGGTGKTPLADWIIRFLISCGERPALLSRGYGRSTKGIVLVSDGERLLCGSRESGDESAMLAARNPGIVAVVAEKRTEGAAFIMRRFAGRPPSVIVLDDAFQHRQLHRDLDIVVVNATEAYFNAAMLPAGRLREPLANIRRADIAVISNANDRKTASAIAADLERRGLQVAQARTTPGSLVPFIDAGKPEAARPGCRVLAFAGIGSPAGFVGSLEACGCRVDAHRFFRDHEPYTREKLLPMLEEARKKGILPVTTEKDYYRMLGEPWFADLSAEYPLHFLEISIAFTEGRKVLEEMLIATIRNFRKA
ncbi:tetraacyldisaccharide 4'-kinase [Chlorobium limicola]